MPLSSVFRSFSICLTIWQEKLAFFFCPALIFPLCMTQSVTLDSLTQRMFHGGIDDDFYFCCTAGGLSAPIVFPPHPLSILANFFLSSIRPNLCLLPI